MATILSEHFTLEELVMSQTAARLGIDNTPTPEVVANLTRLAATLEQVRSLLGVSILISSGYRSPRLNGAIGGSRTSRHMVGLAADFTAPRFGTPKEIALRVASSGIVFDQLIYEYGRWVHIGLAPINEIPRLEQLSKFDAPQYLQGIVDAPAPAPAAEANPVD